MKDYTEQYFKEVQEELVQFNDKFKDSCNNERNNFTERFNQLGEDDDQFNEEFEGRQELLDMLSDVENALIPEALNHLREQMDSKLDEVNRQIDRKLRDEWSLMETQIGDAQHMRNRNIIQEIIETCENFNEEIGKSLNELIIFCR